MPLFDSFDVSKLANKFAGLDVPDDPDVTQGPKDDYGYTHDDVPSDGYEGSPPDEGYPGGPQEGVEAYRADHPGYVTSNPTKDVEEGTYIPGMESYEKEEGAIEDASRTTAAALEDGGGVGEEEGSGDGYRYQGQESLPSGWTKRFNEQYGRWFYVNREKGITQWEKPSSTEDETEEGGEERGAGGQEETSEETRSYGGYHDQQQAGYGGGYGGHQGGVGQEGYGAQAEYYQGQDYGASRQQGAPYQDDYETTTRGEETKEKESSGYGKMFLGAAGGLAVGAVGGALLANALASDGGDEDTPAEEGTREGVDGGAYQEDDTDYYIQDRAMQMEAGEPDEKEGDSSDDGAILSASVEDDSDDDDEEEEEEENVEEYQVPSSHSSSSSTSSSSSSSDSEAEEDGEDEGDGSDDSHSDDDDDRNDEGEEEEQEDIYDEADDEGGLADEDAGEDSD